MNTEKIEKIIKKTHQIHGFSVVTGDSESVAIHAHGVPSAKYTIKEALYMKSTHVLVFPIIKNI